MKHVCLWKRKSECVCACVCVCVCVCVRVCVWWGGGGHMCVFCVCKSVFIYYHGATSSKINFEMVNIVASALAFHSLLTIEMYSDNIEYLNYNGARKTNCKLLLQYLWDLDITIDREHSSQILSIGYIQPILQSHIIPYTSSHTSRATH